MPKVTMGLTDRDVANTSSIKEATHARSNAHAVSIALSLTSFIVTEMRKGNELLLRSPDSGLQKVFMAELANVLEADSAEARNRDDAVAPPGFGYG